jgi:hypothetical protein
MVTITLGLTSCDPNNPIVIEKYSEIVSQGVYATADALIAGRPDEAESYIINLEKIIPIPKNRIKFTPVIYQGIHYVIVNDRETGAQLCVVNSKEFNLLLKAKAINSVEQKAATDFSKQAAAQALADKKNIDALIAANASLKNQLADKDKTIANYQKTIFYKAYIFYETSLWIIPIGIVGLIVLCCFVPAAIPIVGNLFGVVFGIISKIVSGILGAFSK